MSGESKTVSELCREASDFHRFWSKVDIKGPDDCWNWIGSKCQGYGIFYLGNRRERSHRFITRIMGKNIKGLSVMHSCDNPSCVNPSHLSVGTQKDNSIDCVNKGRHKNKTLTHCRRGHPFSKDNTRINRNGWRTCKTCQRYLMNKNKYKEFLENK